MAIWIVRAGKHGEREDFAIQNKVAVIGWEELPDLTGLKDRKELAVLLEEKYPDYKFKTRSNWESQIWPFVKEIKVGDLIVLPLKHQAVIMFGKVTRGYQYRLDFPEYARHSISVDWKEEVPRTKFDQDLLYSLGSAMTVCRIQRHDAETRIPEIINGKPQPPLPIPPEPEEPDVEQISRDQISKYIIQKFKGHGLARLTAAILEAQGFQVRESPEGPDGGVDIIAGRGVLGFESPRLVVQVKSSDTPIDVKVVRELTGVMASFGAESGLIVSWGGFRGVVEKEAAHQFFKIRLWDAGMLVEMLQENYENLSEDIQAELPLKRIWVLVPENEE